MSCGISLTQVVQLEKFGLDGLRLAQRSLADPGPGQVRVRVGAVSLNYRDLMMVLGLYNPRQALPLIPCSDGAGKVVAVGAGSDRLKAKVKSLVDFVPALLELYPKRET